MRIHSPKILTLASVCLWLSGCTTTTLKQTWKSPDLQDRSFPKIAVLAVEERGPVRQGFENRFVEALAKQGQAGMATYGLLDLPGIQADKEAAAARIRAAGAEAILILRLVDQSTQSYQSRATPALYVPTVTGYGSFHWHDYYSVAFVDMGVVWSSSTQNIYLDCSLFDLTGGKRVWSALTLTKVKEDADRLTVADGLVAKVVSAMSRDGIFGR